MTRTAHRRKRPHPARRARRVAGWLSVVAMAGLTGCMAATTKSATATSASTRESTSSSTTTTTPSDDNSWWWSGGASSPAVAGNPSSQPVTSSHAS